MAPTVSKPIDPRQLQQRFDRLGAILGEIATHADAQAVRRCPYRDRHDLCTALFRCRNQAVDDSRASCTHDGRFDYRSAWESDPRAVEQARLKMQQPRHSARRKEQRPQHAARGEEICHDG